MSQLLKSNLSNENANLKKNIIKLYNWLFLDKILNNKGLERKKTKDGL